MRGVLVASYPPVPGVPMVCPRCGGPRQWGDDGCLACKERDAADADNYARMNGGRFISYNYCFSLLVVTYRRKSRPQFVPLGQSRAIPGLRYTLLSLVAGWWGFPWGPMFTVEAVYRNLMGGTDVTAAVITSGASKGSWPVAEPPAQTPQ
jgi:hypothetical protein